MPIYEYQCLKCGHKFEIIRGMNQADDPIECDHCHDTHTERILSKPFVKNGSGSGHSCSSCSGKSCSSCG